MTKISYTAQNYEYISKYPVIYYLILTTLLSILSFALLFHLCKVILLTYKYPLTCPF